ncbi:hypothetical protein L6164_031744 [Bauhinia variegata]|uniref:Uncharacterized protein n=1 Tax=Bauhinia variegata TaxID=167791 RepID=A0ACB9KLA9_BAUVA|nr:hypothetical protein L6164_031744 [Bauhinia variegata]
MKPLEQRFSEFYERWIWKLEQILHELVEVIRHRNHEELVNDAQLQALLSKVTSHVKEFYTVKWAEARENCLPFFSPIWLSPLENAYLWVTGFKPSMVYGFVDSAKNPRVPAEGVAPFVVTAEQGRKIEELRIRTRMEEEKVEREMERIQMSMADRKIVELAKLTIRVQNGDSTAGQVDSWVEAALKGVNAGLEKAMKGADCVRLKALKGVLDVMTPMQGVEFLAAFLTAQLRLRLWGKRRVMGKVELSIKPDQDPALLQIY